MDNIEKKLLITGGTGFLGRNIIERVRSEHKNIKIYNLSSSKLNMSGVEDIVVEARDFNFDLIQDKKFDYIIHCLALSNDAFCQNLSVAEEININFTKKILDFARHQKDLKKFIYISTIILYDSSNQPPVKETGMLNINHTNYSFTKGIAEKYADFYEEKYNLPAVIFRLSNIYGPFQAFENSPFLVPGKIYQAVKDGKIEVFNLSPKRDWIFSKDAAEAICLTLDSRLQGVYNLASGEGTSVEQIILEISRKIKVEYSELGIKTNGPQNFYCDISKLVQELNWRPKTKLSEGIGQTISYIQERNK